MGISCCQFSALVKPTTLFFSDLNFIVLMAMGTFKLFARFRFKYSSKHYHYHIYFGTIPPLLWITSKGINRRTTNNGKIKEYALKESIYFPTKAVHHGIRPNVDVSYTLSHSFSSVINGYKMAEIPSSNVLHDLLREDFDELNKFHERKMIDHKFVHSKEYMRFRVILKPFSWLDNIPILNYIFNISVTAYEDWIIDWKQHRAECLITNDSLRWTFSVDELVIIQGISSGATSSKALRNTTHTKLYKALYINAFIPIPSIMFSNYKKYSDSYINVIMKLAAFRCNSSSVD